MSVSCHLPRRDNDIQRQTVYYIFILHNNSHALKYFKCCHEKRYIYFTFQTTLYAYVLVQLTLTKLKYFSMKFR